MGIPVSRIEGEFILKSLKNERVPVNAHGNNWEIIGQINSYNKTDIHCEIIDGGITPCKVDDEIDIYFNFQNSFFTFSSKIREKTAAFLVINTPEKIYKDTNRGYRRIRLHDDLDISFQLKKQQYQLNFPEISSFYPDENPAISEDFDPASISQLIQSFQNKMIQSVSEHKITMMRDRIPETVEEKLMVKTCKIIWIPSTEKDIPAYDPFKNELILTKLDLIEYKEAQDVPDYNIETEIKDFLFQKKLKGIYSEVYCPIFYRKYLIGYIYVCNKDELKQEISKELIEYIDQFAKVLCYSLKQNDYFKSKLNATEKTFNAPIIDISASGLLFSHTSHALNNDLDIFRELKINFNLNQKRLLLDSWIIRKFKNQDRFYFGVQFRKINQDDFTFLCEFLYNRPMKPQGKYVW